MDLSLPKNEKSILADPVVLLSRSLDDTYQLIDDLDLRIVKAKLCASPKSIGKGFGWPAREADLVISAYRGFLKIIAKSHYDDHFAGRERRPVDIQSPKEKIPASVVDIVWHTHILFTRKYLADCKFIFGYYIHHSPTIQLGDED